MNHPIATGNNAIFLSTSFYQLCLENYREQKIKAGIL